MLEKELKVILSQEQYECVKQMFVWDKVIQQKNYYYVELDNINLDVTVRIREIEGHFKLQVKVPVKKENALHIKKEYECNLVSLPSSINGDFLYEKFGLSFNNRKFSSVGVLKTERNILLAENDVEICLDRNWYLDNMDYELEIEYLAQKPDKLLDRLIEIGISFENEVNGKNSRYLKKYFEKNCIVNVNTI